MAERTVVAVTGATGFVGLNLVEDLAGRGLEVRCLARAGSNTAHLHRWPVTVRHVDLNDEGAVAGALEGVRALLHAANDPADPASISIRSVCRAAAEAGVEQLVFFSTAAVHDIHRGDHAISPDSPTRPGSPYSRYKLAAEGAVRELCDGSPAFTILRPTNVFGPWDTRGVLFRWFLAASEGDLTLLGRGRNRIHLCYVRNLVELSARAILEPRAYGKTYFAADPRAETLEAILATVCSAAGSRLERLPLPPATLTLTEKVLRRINRGRRPFRLPPKLRAHLRHDYQVDLRAGEEDLGWLPAHDLEAATRETVAWYRGFGIL